MSDTCLMTKKDEHPEPLTRSLADLRRAAGLSQTDVAEKMGVKKSRVGHIEARYPNLNYDTVTRYITALGGDIRFTGLTGIGSISADQLIPDPDKAGTREYLSSRPGMGKLIYQPSAAAEELPLQESTPETSSDDTGRDIDQGNPESDQGDREDRQEP